MTSEIFLDWVNILNNKMKKEKRNVLLFIHNAPSHPKLTFSNVTLKFFHANKTSKSQPLDQGIPYNGYFLQLDFFAIWAPKRSILIFAIPFNRKKKIYRPLFS